MADRPRIDLAFAPADRALSAVAAMGLAALLALLAFGSGYIPDRVPLHFGVAGQPDRWGSSSELVLMVLVAVAVYAVLTVVARVPHLYNYPWPITESNAERQYLLARRLMLALRAVVAWLFTGLFWGTAQVARGEASGLGSWPLVLGLGGVGVCLAVYFAAAARER